MRWSCVPPVDDEVRLAHALDAAKKAMRLSAAGSRADLENENDPLADALVRLLSVIGEAAARVSEATRLKHSQISWADIVGMRNHLVHAYFDVDLDILWATVQDDLPPLVLALDAALSELRSQRQT